MTLTPTELRQLSNLFSLADEAASDDFIHLQFVTFWESLREDAGLAALLLKVKAYLKQGGE